MGLLTLRKRHNRLDMQLDRLVQGMENVLERFALYGNVQIKADRFPVLVMPLGITPEHSAHYGLSLCGEGMDQ
jgi:hypothetical protein